MRVIQGPRASAILYNLLTSQRQPKPWLLPANICPIVPITFMKARVPFELVDISAETLHMDLDQAAALIERREFGGILYAHTYGDETTPEHFFQPLKTRHPDLLLVDDRCLCAPDFDRSTIADVVLYSTGYAKIVELHFGGYAFLNGEIEYRSKSLDFDPGRHEQLENAYKSAVRERSRFDYRDTNWLQTDAELPDWVSYKQRIQDGLASSLARRRQLNEIYAARLPAEIQLSPRYQAWRFNIRVREKAAILRAIFDNGLFASSHYASLAGIMSGDRAPAAEALAHEVINLFNDHHFTAEMAERACDVILKTL